jgi:hypothetical protein
MPFFEGERPDDWILRSERYFTINRLSELEMLEATMVSFEGDALSWWRWEQKRGRIRSWGELKLLMLKHFRTTQGGMLCDQFLTLFQTGTVKEFKRRFIEMAAPLDDITEEMYLSRFSIGLKEEIRVELQILEPDALNQAMELAQLVEEELSVQNRSRSSGMGQTS